MLYKTVDLMKTTWYIHTTGWVQFSLVMWSRYRPGLAQRVGRGEALLFHDRGTRREWVVSSRPQPHSTPGKDPVPILQEAGWVPGPVWTGGKSRPHRDSIPDSPARSPVAIPTELPGLCVCVCVCVCVCIYIYIYIYIYTYIYTYTRYIFII